MANKGNLPTNRHEWKSIEKRVWLEVEQGFEEICVPCVFSILKKFQRNPHKQFNKTAKNG